LTKEINVFLSHSGGLLPVEDSAERSVDRSVVMTASLALACGRVTP